MKRVLFLMSVVLFLLPVICFAVVPKSNYVYVSDYADVLNDNTKSYIIQNSSFLKKETKVEYYVVTVPKLNGENVDQYANQLYDSFCSNNRGVIILFAKKERVLKVVLGSELSKIFSNDKIDEYIQSYFMPFFKNEEWDLGLLNGYNAFYKLICDKNKLDSSSIIVDEKVDFMTKYLNYIVVFLTVLSVLFIRILYSLYKKLFVKRKNKNANMDCFLFAFVLSLNLALFIVTYILKPTAIFAILLIEGVCFYSFYNADHPSPSEELPIPPKHIKIIPHKKKNHHKEDNN